MSSSQRGRLVALEGIDGCGKTTQARLLATAIGAVLTFEPGATELGRCLRNVLLDPAGHTPVARAEALLMAADRAQHVHEVVEPALAAGRWVVTDRFSGSTLAYQGYGRGMELDPLRDVVRFAAGGVDADLSVLVDLDPALARARLAGVAPDRLERLDPGFHDRVRRGYLLLADADPTRWAVVDGRPSIESVAEEVLDAVSGRLDRSVTGTR